MMESLTEEIYEAALKIVNEVLYLSVILPCELLSFGFSEKLKGFIFLI